MPDVSELLFGLVLAEAEHHPPSARRWRPLSSDRPKFPASATGCSSSAVGAHALGLSWLRRPVIAVDELSSRRTRDPDNRSYFFFFFFFSFSMTRSAFRSTRSASNLLRLPAFRCCAARALAFLACFASGIG